MGPDEYHEHVDNSVYTNAMARWNLRTALEYVERIRTEHSEIWRTLQEKLELTDEELDTYFSANLDDIDIELLMTAYAEQQPDPFVGENAPEINEYLDAIIEEMDLEEIEELF